MKCLVFNATPLMHFGRAGMLHVLEQLTGGWRRVSPQAVIDEIAIGPERYPDQDDARNLRWLEVVRVDGLAELRVFAAYAEVLGSGQRDIGEAAVLAWAEVHGAVAVVDDLTGKQEGRKRGVEVHGTLWLIFEGFKQVCLDRPAAENLIQRLEDTEQWFPCTAEQAFEWAKNGGLLD